MKAQAETIRATGHRMTVNCRGAFACTGGLASGVIGILASRIKERYHRPVIAFAAAGDGVLKGRHARSRTAHPRCPDEVAARTRLLQKFGGHAMAAGHEHSAVRFRQLARLFDEVVRLHPATMICVRSSIPMARCRRSSLTLDTARAIHDGGPWGQGSAN